MVELDFDTQALEAAADRAIERGIGARGLRAVLEEVMTPSDVRGALRSNDHPGDDYG